MHQERDAKAADLEARRAKRRQAEAELAARRRAVGNIMFCGCDDYTAPVTLGVVGIRACG